ncbi:hypothetical protein DACRYDRAFT_84813 [Dacryopinax primogenitus]|uniref:Plasma membrane fusion protein PRM1 n=1 Tax=Dacryopinax primogenitus (strain DJM 731) TaxID=1858805 RepID=M5FR05_DACPD|nr:uncharacterized protein DACRYDRAFT_84813 [Dacryopinax primogenitus]EJT97254.1 hypothetical protein DACRYDRAFT_84813 [Dacryopinax primogenitus]
MPDRFRAPVDPATVDTPLPPYLRLVDHYSLTWLATPVVSLIFVVIKLVLSSYDVQDAVTAMKADVLASCQAAESAATVAASLPRYMAQGTNKGIVDAVNGTIDGAKDVLILTLQALEALIDFIVDMYRSTFLCFLELVIRGGLAVLIGAVQEVTSFLNTTLSAIGTNIANDVSAAQSAVNSAFSVINEGLSFLPGSPQIPQISLPSLAELGNVTIPTDFENSLISLSNSLPTLSTLKDMLTELIDTPFQDVIQDINNTFNGLSFNENVLAVPAQQTVTFCNATSLDSSIDDLGKIMAKIPIIAIGIALLAIVLIIVANCAWQWYRWRVLMKRVRTMKERWNADAAISGMSQDPFANERSTLTFMAESHHMMILQWLEVTLLKRMFKTPTARNNIRWFLAYITYPPALICLVIGLAGILSVELQLALIALFTGDAKNQVSTAVDGLTDAISTSINAAIASQTGSYVNATNSHILGIQQTIDGGVFGWLNTTTVSLNSTIETFYSDVVSAVNTVFGNTILGPPIQEFVACFLGGKVEHIEEALTWIHQNVQVKLPLMPEDILQLSNSSQTEISTNIRNAAVGDPNVNGGSQGLADQLIAKYTNTLYTERWMFGIFIALWVIVVLVAVCTLVWHNWGKHAVYRWKKARWEKRRALLGDVEPPQKEPMADFGASEKGKDIGPDGSLPVIVTPEPASLKNIPHPPSPMPSPGLPPFPPPRTNTRGSPIINVRPFSPPTVSPSGRVMSPELPAYSSRAVPRQLTPSVPVPEENPFLTPFDDRVEDRYPRPSFKPHAL